MVPIIEFVFFLLRNGLWLLELAIIASAILSWLFAFDVINYRNRGVRQIADLLDSIVAPVLAPFRSFIPPLGGIDVSPIVVILLIEGLRKILLPASEDALIRLVTF